MDKKFVFTILHLLLDGYTLTIKGNQFKYVNNRLYIFKDKCWQGYYQQIGKLVELAESLSCNEQVAVVMSREENDE